MCRRELLFLDLCHFVDVFHICFCVIGQICWYPLEQEIRLTLFAVESFSVYLQRFRRGSAQFHHIGSSASRLENNAVICGYLLNPQPFFCIPYFSYFRMLYALYISHNSLKFLHAEFLQFVECPLHKSFSKQLFVFIP